MSRVLAEGTIRYRAADPLYPAREYWGEWAEARVFVLEYEPPTGSGDAHVTIVAREPLSLPGYVVPAPIGSIHRMQATDGLWDDSRTETVETLLTLDVDALVPA